MNKLQENITNLFGQPGADWLDQLPTLTECFTREWNLTDLQSAGNMTYNYVTKANHPQHGPVVVKVSFNEDMITDEIRALRHFSGKGMVNLITTHSSFHAILLHQAISGYSLQSHYPEDSDKTLQTYARIVMTLANARSYFCFYA